MFGFILLFFTSGVGDDTNRFTGRREKVFILLSFKEDNSEQRHDSGCEESPFKVLRIPCVSQETANQRSSKRTYINTHIENGVCSIQPPVSGFVELTYQRRDSGFEATIAQDQEA